MTGALLLNIEKSIQLGARTKFHLIRRNFDKYRKPDLERRFRVLYPGILLFFMDTVRKIYNGVVPEFSLRPQSDSTDGGEWGGGLKRRSNASRAEIILDEPIKGTIDCRAFVLKLAAPIPGFWIGRKLSSAAGTPVRFGAISRTSTTTVNPVVDSQLLERSHHHLGNLGHDVRKSTRLLSKTPQKMLSSLFSNIE